MLKNNIIGFHHICIKAQNIEQTIVFYQSLGFEISHSWSLPQFNITKCTMMYHSIAGVYIEICDKNANMPTQGRKRIEAEEYVENSILHFSFIVEDAVVAYENAMKNGAKCLNELDQIDLYDPNKKKYVTARNSLVYSPNGEVIEFLEKDPFKVLKVERL